MICLWLCDVMLCDVSCHVMSCHVMSCHVIEERELMSCRVVSCHVMSCHVMSCLGPRKDDRASIVFDRELDAAARGRESRDWGTSLYDDSQENRRS